MSDERKRATIERSNSQTIHVTDVETGRTAAITIRGGKVKLECLFPNGMLVRRAELLDDVAAVGVQS